MKTNEFVIGAVIGAALSLFLVLSVVVFLDVKTGSAIIDKGCAYYHEKTGKFTWREND